MKRGKAIKMGAKYIPERIFAIKAADASNDIKGIHVIEYARSLSLRWVSGELTAMQKQDMLRDRH